MYMRFLGKDGDALLFVMTETLELKNPLIIAFFQCFCLDFTWNFSILNLELSFYFPWFNLGLRTPLIFLRFGLCLSAEKKSIKTRSIELSWIVKVYSMIFG